MKSAAVLFALSLAPAWAQLPRPPAAAPSGSTLVLSALFPLSPNAWMAGPEQAADVRTHVVTMKNRLPTDVRPCMDLLLRVSDAPARGRPLAWAASPTSVTIATAVPRLGHSTAAASPGRTARHSTREAE